MLWATFVSSIKCDEYITEAIEKLTTAKHQANLCRDYDKVHKIELIIESLDKI